MLRHLTELLAGSVERRVRAVVLDVDVTAVVVVLAAVSLGFGSFAAYLALASAHGQIAAAVILCTAYGLAAGTIAAGWAAHRRAGRPPLLAAAPTPAAPLNINSLLGALGLDADVQGQPTLAAAMQLGREASPLRLVALAAVGGFLAGRELRK